MQHIARYISYEKCFNARFIKFIKKSMHYHHKEIVLIRPQNFKQVIHLIHCNIALKASIN